MDIALKLLECPGKPRSVHLEPTRGECTEHLA